MEALAKVFSFFWSVAFAYQSFQAFRAAFSGENNDGSAPVPNPESARARLGAFVWGTISGALALLGVVGIFAF